MILAKIQTLRVQQVPRTHSHGTRLTDHRAAKLLININENQRGPNYWKLNTSLLEDENYKAIIKDLIHRYNTTLEYEKLDVDLHILWEQLKPEIRTKSISYSKSLSKSFKQTINKRT